MDNPKQELETFFAALGFIQPYLTHSEYDLGMNGNWYNYTKEDLAVFKGTPPKDFLRAQVDKLV